MGSGSVFQNADDFLFRQDVTIIQREQERLANGQGSCSGNVLGYGHDLLCFLVGYVERSASSLRGGAS
ncbi:hypothetical protein Ga0058931_1660 [Roseibaca calidilacus]|uniref:Uncharacterized protein n=1 Tax=Roseibaca calidilacus TaxID=1666912 RepID=A0ABP2BYT6_9RHOB|nr:hypothetical protein Ga0058931_1660 [Roseibaca calidilacus]